MSVAEYSELLEMAASLLSRPEDAEDAVHEGYLNWVRDVADAVGPHEPLIQHVRREAERLARQQRRARGRFLSLEEAIHLATDGHTVRDEVASRELRALVMAAVLELPAQSRQPLIAHYLHGTRLADILPGVPVPTVWSRIRRALFIVGAALRPIEQDRDGANCDKERSGDSSARDQKNQILVS